MDNSIYITLSRELALFRDMDMTANNIANANTTGYQAQKVMFSEYLEKDNNSGDRNSMSLTDDKSEYRNTQQGSMAVTGGQLDVAINGSGYFMIQTPLGIRYTRAGNFQLDAEGTLVNVEGYPVLDNGEQPIIFPADANDVKIGTGGNITVNNENFGNLGVAVFENAQLLRPTSGSMFNSEATPTIGDEDSVRVVQGVLENSNVQPVNELTHMITVSRAVGNTAKFMEIVNDLQRKASNTWAQQS